MNSTERGRRQLQIALRAELPEQLSLRQICQCTGLTASELMDMVEAGLIETGDPPPGEASMPGALRFPSQALGRVQAALRLQRDLDLNLAGVVLVLEMRDRLRRLESELERLRLLFPDS